MSFAMDKSLLRNIWKCLYKKSEISDAYAKNPLKKAEKFRMLYFEVIYPFFCC